MDLSGGNGSFGEDESDDVNDFYGFLHSLDIMHIIVYCLVFVLGIPGNGAVIWATGFKLKKTVNTVWFLNLAVADFLFIAFSPLTVAPLPTSGHWPFVKFMCNLNYSVGFLTMYTSVYVLMVISVDRCVSVVRPVWAQNHRSVRKASYVSLGVWLLALVFSSPEFIFMDSHLSPHDENFTMCFKNFAFSDDYDTIARLLLGFVVPFTVIVSCYAVIMMKRSLPSHSGHPFKITAAVITAYFLCWAPFHITKSIPRSLIMKSIPTNNEIIEIVMFSIAVCLAILSRCLNPLLYVFMGQDFKNKGCKPILKVLESAFTEEEPRSNPPTNFTISDAE